MKLNFITNPDPNLQEKMRFFADYFLYVNEYLGRLPEIPFDNPYTLLDKIIFQIENNFQHCKSYIPNYFNQFFSFYKDLGSKEDILTVKKLYNEYHTQKPDDKNTWILNNQNFIVEIKRLHEEYKRTLFDDNFSALFSFLQCPHSLKKHEKGIKYCIQILVSQFRLNNYSKNDIDSCIDRILSSDKFPFPPEILQIKENVERNKAEKDFLEKRDFKEQFYGLKHLLIRPEFQSGNFIFVIENCSLDKELQENFKVKFDKITFISPFHSTLTTLRQDLEEKNKNHPYEIYQGFFRDNILLACVNLKYDTISSTKENGLKIVLEELQLFNKHINAELKVNTTDYLFSENLLTVDNGNITPSNQSSKYITRHDLNSSEKNVYEVLRNISSEAKNQILHNENVFLRTLQQDEISSYWQYIENIFWVVNITNPLDVQKKFSKLLLKQVNKLRRNFLSQMNLIVFPFGLDYKEIGLDEEDIFIPVSKSLKEMDPNFNIVLFESKIKNHLLKEIIKYYKNFNSEEQYKKWFEYFRSLILELYEYRNADLHSGKVNEFTKIKLQAVLPSIINNTRLDLINACITNPTLSFKELINLLVTT